MSWLGTRVVRIYEEDKRLLELVFSEETPMTIQIRWLLQAIVEDNFGNKTVESAVAEHGLDDVVAGIQNSVRYDWARK